MKTAPFFSAEENQIIQQLLRLKSFQVVLNPMWGSQNAEYRDRLHQELKYESRRANSFSISHSPSLGGFIATVDEKVQLGFDIEVTERVKDEVARRICRQASEFEQAPSAASLWTAKEAAYKALRGPHQPPVISEITVGNWGIFQSRFETFQFVRQESRSKFLNYGVVMRKDFYTFAFFTFTT